MAKYGPPSWSFYLINGVSMLAAKVKSVSRKVENLLEPSHGLGDSWEEHDPTGMARGTLTQDGAFFDDATGGMHDTLSANSTTARVACVGNAGNTLGQAFTGLKGVIQAGYEVLGRIGELTKANAQYSVTGNVEEGVILQPHTQIAATTTGSSHDNSASSASGGAIYLQVSQAASITSVTCKVQHSADDSTWADLGTFAAVTPAGAPTAERVAINGTINRYTRAVSTFSGSGTATVMVGICRN